MKTKFFWMLRLLLVSSFSLLPGFAQAQFTHTLEIDDGIDSTGIWHDGNGNGVMEPGETVELIVRLKNEGEAKVENVVGTLSTKNNFVHILDKEVNYESIPLDESYHAPLFDVFKIQTLANLPTQVVKLSLKLEADNGGLWHIPIELNMINPEGIGISLPEGLITEVAVGKTSTYFILNAKYPTLTGTDGEKISYGSFKITLHTPTDTQPFIFPIKTKAENVQEMAIETGVKFVISLGLKEIPFASTIISVLDLFFKSLSMTNRDLTVNLQNLIPDPERPEIEKEYLVLLKNMPRSLGGIDITMKQEYNLGSSVNRDEVEIKHFWNFNNGWDAPPAQPLEISDYPPFHSLPPEVQEYLLVEFAATRTPERWLIPDETAMNQNYPNPFNPETWIPYQLAEDSEVSITIYDATGTIVRSLPLGLKPAGYYTVKERAAYWDGRNTHGETLASGLYFYQLKTDQISLLRKMVILK